MPHSTYIPQPQHLVRTLSYILVSIGKHMRGATPGEDLGDAASVLASCNPVHLADAFRAPDANTLEVWVWSTVDRAMTPEEPREVAGTACSPFTHLDESRGAWHMAGMRQRAHIHTHTHE